MAQLLRAKALTDAQPEEILEEKTKSFCISARFQDSVVTM
jgi:hypothetical protein